MIRNAVGAVAVAVLALTVAAVPLAVASADEGSDPTGDTSASWVLDPSDTASPSWSESTEEPIYDPSDLPSTDVTVDGPDATDDSTPSIDPEPTGEPTGCDIATASPDENGALGCIG
jgi:hypothetical protein